MKVEKERDRAEKNNSGVWIERREGKKRTSQYRPN